ncbi:MAG: hypothetical protein ACP5HG_04905 [Anaerolineae bacterium]
MTATQERVCIRGDPNQIDSFVACLVAVLHAWDRPVGYDWIAGLSGVAFSPVLEPGEDCMAWWMEAGSDARIPFLGRTLGFTVERVIRDVAWDDDARATYANTELLPPPHEAHFARLRAAFDRGDAILLRTWPAWSVLIDWDPNLDRLEFATVPGFEDLVARIWGPAQAQLAYILTPIEPDIDLEESIEMALRFGAKVAAGRGPDERLRYGAALYAAAADRMRKEVFCPFCGGNSDSCAHRTLMRMLGTQRSAPGFLNDARDFIETTQPSHDAVDLPWQVAIDRFEAMEELASVYCGWADFQERWPDEAFREALCDTFETLADLQTEAAEALAELAVTYARQFA